MVRDDSKTNIVAGYNNQYDIDADGYDSDKPPPMYGHEGFAINQGDGRGRRRGGETSVFNAKKKCTPCCIVSVAGLVTLLGVGAILALVFTNVIGGGDIDLSNEQQKGFNIIFEENLIPMREFKVAESRLPNSSVKQALAGKNTPIKEA